MASVHGKCKLRPVVNFYIPSQGNNNQVLSQMQSAGLAPNDRRRDQRDDRRRVSQAGNIAPPSPALVRHGSKQRKVPAALGPGNGAMPGQITPHSAAAQVNVPVGSPRGTPQHPYANVSGTGYEFNEDGYGNQQQYGRASPMVSSVGAAPPAVSNVRARAGDVGVSQGGEYRQDAEDAPPKLSLIRILTCRCG